MSKVAFAALQAYASVLHRLRPNAGLTRMSFNSITNPLFAKLEGPLVASLPGGIRMEVDHDEYHGRILWLAGSNDWKVSRAVTALLRSGDILLDIGANYGSIGLAASRVVGSTGAVHLFEPQQLINDRLKHALEKSGLNNVYLHRVALSDSDGQVALARPVHHRGQGSIVAVDPEHAGWVTEVVETRETSKYLSGLVGDRPFGVKIDIEGAEPKVLPGVIDLPGLRFVVFEGCNSERWLWEFFSDRRYSVFGLERSPVRPRARLVSDFSHWHQFHDFVALKSKAPVPDRAFQFRSLEKMISG